ncbi:hypothetical protein AMECASPLE_036625 [Ameca splendens]|uniref:Uncharacterized protein n=1 Tax=Ameca splendens TaxID=208324 RepID=A0ABV0ZHD2_9TELE
MSQHRLNWEIRESAALSHRIRDIYSATRPANDQPPRAADSVTGLFSLINTSTHVVFPFSWLRVMAVCTPIRATGSGSIGC